jgi:hypothetical protein
VHIVTHPSEKKQNNIQNVARTAISDHHDCRCSIKGEYIQSKNATLEHCGQMPRAISPGFCTATKTLKDCLAGNNYRTCLCHFDEKVSYLIGMLLQVRSEETNQFNHKCTTY